MGGIKQTDLTSRETNLLAGHFQRIVEDCKAQLPLFDEFLTKSIKLQNQVKSTIVAFGSFLDTFQKIADCASSTRGSSTDIGICLTRMVLRHRAMEAHLYTLASALSDCCVFPIQSRKEEWRRKLALKEKDHSREFKKMRAVLKKRADSIVKIDKKIKKSKGDAEMHKLRESMVKDLELKRKMFEEQEKTAVKEISCQERAHYSTFAACLKPLVAEELAMLREVEQLEEVMEKVNRIIMDPFKNLETTDNILSRLNNSEESSFYIATPSSSPGGSALGSRTGSIRSMNSSSFSRASSASSREGSIGSRSNSMSSDRMERVSDKMTDLDSETRKTKRDSTISTYSRDSGLFLSPRLCHSPSQSGRSPSPYLASSYQKSSEVTVTSSPQRQKPSLPVRSSSLDRHGAHVMERSGHVPDTVSSHYSAPSNNSRVGETVISLGSHGLTTYSVVTKPVSTVDAQPISTVESHPVSTLVSPVTVEPPLSGMSSMSVSDPHSNVFDPSVSSPQGPPSSNPTIISTLGFKPSFTVSSHADTSPLVSDLSSTNSMTQSEPGVGSQEVSTSLSQSISSLVTTDLESPVSVCPGVEEDSKTPTNERLSILQYKMSHCSLGGDDSSSGGSVGSTSSGYSSLGTDLCVFSKGTGQKVNTVTGTRGQETVQTGSTTGARIHDRTQQGPQQPVQGTYGVHECQGGSGASRTHGSQDTYGRQGTQPNQGTHGNQENHGKQGTHVNWAMHGNQGGHGNREFIGGRETHGIQETLTGQGTHIREEIYETHGNQGTNIVTEHGTSQSINTTGGRTWSVLSELDDLTPHGSMEQIPPPPTVLRGNYWPPVNRQDSDSLGYSRWGK